jgi:hypothetical protein
MPPQTASFPSPLAQIPQDAPPILGAVLRSVKDWHSWPDKQRRERLQRYFENTQYDQRAYNWAGEAIAEGSEDFFGQQMTLPSEEAPPLSMRRPPSKYPIGGIIVTRLTNLVFGEERFPRATAEDDPDTTDFIEGLVKVAQLPERMQHARNAGGSEADVMISYGYADGAPRAEVHLASQLIVLAWADYAERRPRHVVKLWSMTEPQVDPKTGRLVQEDVWMAREWRGALAASPGRPAEPGVEAIYRYVPDDKAASRPPMWVRLSAEPCEECQVVWMVNKHALDDSSGKGDFEGMEGLIDDLIISLNGTVTGTAQNADPTMMVDLPPGAMQPNTVRKGGSNVIFGKAGYLEISGSSTTAGIAVTDRMRAYAFESCHLAMLDPEKLVGAQSGEAMRRMLFPTVDYCNTLRTAYGSKGLLRVIEGLLRLARRILASPPPQQPVLDAMGNPILDADGNQVTQSAAGWAFKLPPKVTKETGPDGKERVVSATERLPGNGEMLTLVWPDYFSKSSADKLAEVQYLQAGNGQQPIFSQRTTVRQAAPMVGVQDIDAEMKAIAEGTKAMADAQAGSLGELTAHAKAGVPLVKNTSDGGVDGSPESEGNEDEAAV